MKIRPHKNFNPNRLKTLMDIGYVVVASAVVILTAIAIIDSDQHVRLFTFVFALAAILNLMSGIPLLRCVSNQSRKRTRMKGFFFCLAAMVLSGFVVVTIFAFWR